MLVLNNPRQGSLKLVHPNGHLETVERVRHDVLGIGRVDERELIRRVLGRCQEQELCARASLEAGSFKVGRFKRLDSAASEGARNGMHAVKGAGQDQPFVGVERLEAGSELSLVDEPTGLVDDDETKDDPVGKLVEWIEQAATSS